MTALLSEGIPAWTIQPSATLRCRDGVVIEGPGDTVEEALQLGLVPVVHGDVSLDSVRGGTIVSTEEIFEYMLARFQPQRLVLAGEVDGVYDADPLETTNLAGDPGRGDVLADLRKRVDDWMRETKDRLLEGEWPPTKEQVARLESDSAPN